MKLCDGAGCGEGYRCTEGICQPCDGLACMDPGGADMAMGWDQNAPATPIAACRAPRKGWQLTGKMAACQTGPQFPDQICNDVQGWVPCQANQLTAAQCSSIPWGFFGSRQHGRQDTATPDSTMSCTWNGGAGATSTEQRFIFGCGNAGAVVTYDIAENPCGGFQRAVPCHGSPFSAASSWDCPYPANTDQDAGQVSTSDMLDGELCCHA